MLYAIAMGQITKTQLIDEKESQCCTSRILAVDWGRGTSTCQ